MGAVPQAWRSACHISCGPGAHRARLTTSSISRSMASNSPKGALGGKRQRSVRFPAASAGPPYTLDKSDTLYLLTQDITAAGTAILVTGSNVTLELDGHRVTFGSTSSAQVFGVHVQGGKTVVRNGHVVQGDAAGDYSSCVETRWRSAPVEVLGITTEVHRPNGYPLRLFGSAQDASIHHNHLFSTVT